MVKFIFEQKPKRTHCPAQRRYLSVPQWKPFEKCAQLDWWRAHFSLTLINWVFSTEFPFNELKIQKSANSKRFGFRAFQNLKIWQNVFIPSKTSLSMAFTMEHLLHSYLTETDENGMIWWIQTDNPKLWHGGSNRENPSLCCAQKHNPTSSCTTKSSAIFFTHFPTYITITKTCCRQRQFINFIFITAITPHMFISETQPSAIHSPPYWNGNMSHFHIDLRRPD